MHLYLKLLLKDVKYSLEVVVLYSLFYGTLYFSFQRQIFDILYYIIFYFYTATFSLFTLTLTLA